MSGLNGTRLPGSPKPLSVQLYIGGFLTTFVSAVVLNPMGYNYTCNYRSAFRELANRNVGIYGFGLNKQFFAYMLAFIFCLGPPSSLPLSHSPSLHTEVCASLDYSNRPESWQHHC